MVPLFHSRSRYGGSKLSISVNYVKELKCINVLYNRKNTPTQTSQHFASCLGFKHRAFNQQVCICWIRSIESAKNAYDFIVVPLRLLTLSRHEASISQLLNGNPIMNKVWIMLTRISFCHLHDLSKQYRGGDRLACFWCRFRVQAHNKCKS